MRKRAAVVVASILALMVVCIPAEAVQTSYHVQLASATWTVETDRPDRPVVYTIDARRYEDRSNGDVHLSFRATRYKCHRNDSGSLHCGGGRKRFRTYEAIQGSFSMEWDMSLTRLRFSDRGTTIEAELGAPEATSDPIRWMPQSFGHRERCPQGEGEGSGFARATDGLARWKGQYLEPHGGDDHSYVATFELTTECSPLSSSPPSVLDLDPRTTNDQWRHGTQLSKASRRTAPLDHILSEGSDDDLRRDSNSDYDQVAGVEPRHVAPGPSTSSRER